MIQNRTKNTTNSTNVFDEQKGDIIRKIFAEEFGGKLENRLLEMEKNASSFILSSYESTKLLRKLHDNMKNILGEEITKEGKLQENTSSSLGCCLHCFKLFEKKRFKKMKYCSKHCFLRHKSFYRSIKSSIQFFSEKGNFESFEWNKNDTENSMEVEEIKSPKKEKKIDQ